MGFSCLPKKGHPGSLENDLYKGIHNLDLVTIGVDGRKCNGNWPEYSFKKGEVVVGGLTPAPLKFSAAGRNNQAGNGPNCITEQKHSSKLAWKVYAQYDTGVTN
jgi:hypothetical protein